VYVVCESFEILNPYIYLAVRAAPQRKRGVGVGEATAHRPVASADCLARGVGHGAVEAVAVEVLRAGGCFGWPAVKKAGETTTAGESSSFHFAGWGARAAGSTLAAGGATGGSGRPGGAGAEGATGGSGRPGGAGTGGEVGRGMPGAELRGKSKVGRTDGAVPPCRKEVGAGLNGAAAGERLLVRAAARSAGGTAGRAAGGTAGAVARGRRPAGDMRLTEMQMQTACREETRTRTRTGGRNTKHGGHAPRTGSTANRTGG